MIVFNASSAFEDGCCIVWKPNGDKIETASLPQSKSTCSKGNTLLESFKVCTWLQDPDNRCPEYTPEDRCKQCGYFWNGECFKEDPVEKAKKELEKERQEKEKQKSKAK